MLDSALYAGISYSSFWNMDIEEVNRLLKVFNKKQEDEIKKEASMNYVLADLIGISVARTYSKKVKYPKLKDVYPDLFKETEEEEAEEQDKRSIANLKAFAIQHNKKFQ